MLSGRSAKCASFKHTAAAITDVPGRTSPPWAVALQSRGAYTTKSHDSVSVQSVAHLLATCWANGSTGASEGTALISGPRIK
eukprot:scaffold101544_cov60-Phaeocystis_antarctica.AAC.3